MYSHAEWVHTHVFTGSMPAITLLYLGNPASAKELTLSLGYPLVNIGIIGNRQFTGGITSPYVTLG